MGAIVEYRNFGAKLETRDVGAGGNLRLGGYAATFNVLSRPLGAMQFREKIDPHAFDETLAGRPDVRFTLNHNPNYVMGRTVAGTLKLFTDRVGLGFDVDLPDTATARHLVTSVKRGDISDCSFQFKTLDDAWSQDDNGNPIRTLKKVSLNDGDVAAVAYPAYPETQISARAIQEIERRGRELLGISDYPARVDRGRLVDAELADMMVKVGPTTPLLYGYATVFHRYGANMRTGLQTCLLRGAFAESIERDLVTANLPGHDERVFASTADGSLKLTEDETGLRFEIRSSLIAPEECQRIFEKVQRGKIQEMSIDYGWRADDLHEDLAKRARFIHKARLYHVSPVKGGSFPGTSIRAGYGTLESIAAVEASARDRELDLAQLEG